MQEIIQNVAISIHDGPTSIIPPFELLLDEDSSLVLLDEDFLRDAIESIAQYYNARYTGDVSMPYQNKHTVV